MESPEIRLKVCGMRDRENILQLSRLKPDYMGFIFYPASPRYVGEDFVVPEISSDTLRVGVFVNAGTEDILLKTRNNALDFVQLHGEESPAQCLELKKSGVGIIKVFSVDDEMDFRVTENYKDVVDFFLFDTKGKHYGGNARTFNWEVLSRYDQTIPFFLSGGITPNHVESIRKLELPFLQVIDVNSGVEISPALKDINKISAMKALLNPKS
jgi:phosphoribosylanthranilate isomerase